MDIVKVDSWMKSALIGRIMGAILFISAMILQGYGYTLGADDQKVIVDTISMVTGGIGSIFVIASKVRESGRKQ